MNARSSTLTPAWTRSPAASTYVDERIDAFRTHTGTAHLGDLERPAFGGKAEKTEPSGLLPS
ncbi:hypothetical protein ACFYT4_16755 [Streptomyces sp. NPDC004609]|uniref:hypothetical protein n=1 Tax=Streptomyces sp. NPDC004609 TaxID=3364704 RepID=UPI00367AAC1D